MKKSLAIRRRVSAASSGLLDSGRLLARPEWSAGDGPADGIRVGKVAADGADPVTVFLVGIRINRWRAPWHWLPLLLALPAMIRDLAADPDSGLLGYRLLLGPGPRQAMLVQYWRDAEALHGFAGDPASAHYAAQKRLWRHYAAADAAVGVWHEVLAVSAPASLYGNMPPTGIGALREVRPLAWAVSGPEAGAAPGGRTLTDGDGRGNRRHSASAS